MGINVPGGLEAALLFTLVTLGGLGESATGDPGRREDARKHRSASRPPAGSSALVPVFAWKIKPTGEYRLPALLPAPLAQSPTATHRKDVALPRNFLKTALAIQTAELPDESIAEEVCSACGVEPQTCTCSRLKPAVSSVSCRLPRAWRKCPLGLGLQRFPLDKVLSFSGSAANSARHFRRAHRHGPRQQFHAHGSVARYIVNCVDAEIERVLPHMAFSAEAQQKDLRRTLRRAERDIFKMDTDVHKVAASR
jgi:methenyltetrahydromethanopterin cyclohydrolase